MKQATHRSLQNGTQAANRKPAQLAVAHEHQSADPPPAESSSEPLKCVWSGHLGHKRDCRSRIPASVVVRAWHREMQLKGTEEGFFYFSWRHGVWLAYGLADGGVRGVYCPTHCSERGSREGQGPDPSAHRPAGIALH